MFDEVLIGMNAVVMDNARVGADSLVGALAFIPAEMEIPEKKIVIICWSGQSICSNLRRSDL